MPSLFNAAAQSLADGEKDREKGRTEPPRTVSASGWFPRSSKTTSPPRIPQDKPPPLRTPPTLCSDVCNRTSALVLPASGDGTATKLPATDRKKISSHSLLFNLLSVSSLSHLILFSCHQFGLGFCFVSPYFFIIRIKPTY